MQIGPAARGRSGLTRETGAGNGFKPIRRLSGRSMAKLGLE